MPSFADFPPELVYDIFLHAAQSSTPTCHTLCQVSTWTRRLALPHLYTTISIKSKTDLSSLLRSLDMPPVLPPSTEFQPGHAVRSIWVSSDAGIYETLGILFHRCPNVIYIALHSVAMVKMNHRRQYLPRESDRERGLHMLVLQNHAHPDWDWYNHYRYRDGDHPAPITHLRLEDPVDFGNFLRAERFFRLTHIAMPCNGSNVGELARIPPVFKGTSLQFFVLILTSVHLREDQCRGIEDWVQQARRVEERIYVVKPLYDELKDEWNVEVRGGATIWERASEYTRLLMNSSDHNLIGPP